MATNTASIFGKSNFSIVQCNVYVKRVSSGSWQDETGWIDLKRSESVTFKNPQEKAGMKSMQTGTKDANRVVVGEEVTLEPSLGEAGLEILQAVLQGFAIEYHAGGGGTVVKRAGKASSLGSVDTDNLMWVKTVKLKGGAESTNPLDTVYFIAAPGTEEFTLVFDTSTQQFLGLMLKGYDAGPNYVEVEADQVFFDNEDGQPVPAYYWTGETEAPV